MLLAVLLALTTAAGFQDPARSESTYRFFSRSRTFALEVPSDWRQMSPDEARRLRELLPPQLHHTEPAYFYAVGAVDRWLAGEFDGRYLFVVEQREEWPMDEARERLALEWGERGAQEGIDFVLEDVHQVRVGTEEHEVIECIRRTRPAGGGQEVRSLDLYAPTGGRMVLLSFTAPAEDFERALPGFREMVATLTFSRPARGSATLEDKLLMPVITGILVGLILAILYKRRRTS